MTKRRSYDSFSWTVVRLPERDLAEVVLEVAAPLLARLGPMQSIEEARAVIELTVTFWNASVLASKCWGHPKVKALNELKQRLRGRQASRDDVETFDLLAEGCREHWLDPRLVERWTYEADAAGVRRLVCTIGLPDRVKADIPPPIEKRIAIGGIFLDEVKVPRGGNSFSCFPIEHHRGFVGEDVP